MSSSESGDEVQSRVKRHSIMRPLSDYETGESSDRTFRVIRLASKENELEYDFTSHSDCDFSTDDSVVTRRRVKNIKRPLSSTSTSDLSDSDVPFGSGRFKRIKLTRNSGSNNSESIRDLGEPQIELQATSNEQTNNSNTTIKDNPTGSLVAGTPRFEEEECSSDRIHFPEGRRRRMQLIESESESDLVSTSHIVRGRRHPVIESEDESVSPNEYSRRNSGLASMQRLSHQRVVSVLHTDRTRNRRRRRRRNSRQQVNGSNIAINLSYSASNTRNVRLQVDSTNVNSELDRQNTWRITNISAEETEDDCVPVTNGHRVRGRRIPVIESETDSDVSSNTPGNSEVLIRNREIETVNNPEVNAVNLRLRRRIATNLSNTMSNYSESRTAIVESENDSSNSDSNIRPRTLSNRTLRVLQSDDSTSSFSIDSDDSIPIRNRRHRTRPIPIVDYELEDIHNDFATFDVNIKASTVIKALANNDEVDGNSSETDGESEKCPICLAGFKLQEVAKPLTCDHKFCSLCLKEWATKSNTCPVDRKVFNCIIIYDKNEGRVLCELPVGNVSPQDDEFDFVEEFLSDSSDESSWYFSDEDGPVEVCSTCRFSHSPHRMIGCDSCSAVFHLGCIFPPLQDFPAADWFCSNCLYGTDTFSDSD